MRQPTDNNFGRNKSLMVVNKAAHLKLEVSSSNARSSPDWLALAKADAWSVRTPLITSSTVVVYSRQ